MTHDQHSLIDQLFQSVTPYLEDAFDAVLSSRPSDRTNERVMARVRQLQSAARGLAAIAVAIEAVLPLAATQKGEGRTGLLP